MHLYAALHINACKDFSCRPLLLSIYSEILGSHSEPEQLLLWDRMISGKNLMKKKNRHPK